MELTGQKWANIKQRSSIFGNTLISLRRLPFGVNVMLNLSNNGRQRDLKIWKTVNNNDHNQVFWARETEHPQQTIVLTKTRWSATWFWSLLSKVFRKIYDRDVDENVTSEYNFALVLVFRDFSISFTSYNVGEVF